MSATATIAALMREPEGLWPNLLALGYAVPVHGIGLVLLCSGIWPVWLLGVLLTAHTLVIAAYLIHEAAHMNLFRSLEHNRWVGELLLFVTGAGYASFERVRHMHLRHHRDRADPVRFDLQGFLRSLPPTPRRLIDALEWAYVPIAELIMHWQVVLRPFIHADEAPRRTRVLLMLALRGSLFALLLWWSPWALAGYAVAYALFLQVMNFFDAFHHTFDQYVLPDDHAPVPMEGKDREYELDHTYSNVVSVRWPWLNLLTLNFGFHNAHHERASVPWYRLPQLHAELYGTSYPQLLPLHELLRTFHVNRVRRIQGDDYGSLGTGPGRADDFVGAHAVSFLTVV